MSAAAVSYGSCAQFQNVKRKESKINGFKVSCVYSSAAVSDPYKTLKITRGASKSEVKKAFRQLALQYHPDVCRENNCGIQFQQISEAYDTVISNLRGKPNSAQIEMFEHFEFQDEPMREEWMGWEVRDYSSHINSYA